MKILNIPVLISLTLLLLNGAFSQEKDTTFSNTLNSQQTGFSSLLNDVTLSGQWFLVYQTSRINEEKAKEAS